jgi:hypothetical protein
MKKNEWYGSAIIAAIAVVLLGAGYFAWFAPKGESPTKSQTYGAADQQQTMPNSDEITLSGTVGKDDQLVADNGKEFELSNTDKGLEVKSLTGQKVEVTGTVMEEAGQRVIDVHEYKVLE